MHAKLTELRRKLHQFPEVSGQEFKTAKRVQDFIHKNYPGELISQIGGPSFAVLYNFGTEGNTVAIRCELDALPIIEKNGFEYKSNFEGVSHKCGHDGHMAMVAGLVFWLKEQNFKKGRVVLVFQSAEETGKGAYEMLEDVKFKALNIDYIFALHNIPGVDLHTVITMKNGFSAEVESFVLKLSGLASHAAEPQNGINPTLGIAELTQELDKLNISNPNAENFQVLTPVHIRIGEANYGISPGEAELHYTIRTWSLKTMEQLKTQILNIINQISKQHQLKHEMNWLEHFPASENDLDCNSIIKDAAENLHFNIEERSYPFKFGEDFGWFSRHYKTGMFGLGSGLQTAPLHNPSYDFPDEIIPTGIAVFGEILKKTLEDR
ncbi:amidohydrolase [Tenacibaculum jejuense]|uniref:Probable amidohydrolase, family M20 peptidase n=1 Tax=Tenacibaculum jejuense TaxID=584609 RepID=A0A238UDK6_9FLAO|nr:amidohydrolase [Tenacibaculum jejuense]SNR17277.1 Probable amidohydrolase, family M20 peptidase [Tenacibaculum jejuense]